MGIEDEDYGRALSASEIAFETPDAIQGEEPPASTAGLGNALWLYQKLGTINGVPVAASARGLPIEGDDTLQAAFILDRHPRCAIFRLHDGECPDKVAYDTLLDRAYAGEVAVVSESEHFDEVKGHFLLLVKYEELQYVLHPRYEFLKSK